MPFAYDEVLYKSHPMGQTHPDHLAALATIFGVNPSPPERCRVLELGCGNGANLIPMALTLPDSRLTGVDLAAKPIETAVDLASEVGVHNCTFHRLDLAELTAEFGEFDYIIAHGVYSWVPAAVRDKLLAVCRLLLAANGVAYVSYNAYPGCHLRNITRDMMLYQTRGITDPEERLRQAGALVRFLAQAEPGSTALREELKVVGSRDPSVLFHDDLAEVNQPVYFHEFIEDARAHGLEFLAEAQFSSMQEAAFAPEVVEGVRLLAGEDRVRKQQYLDFLKCRRFHQTLLCRAGTPIQDPPDAWRLERLWLASAAERVSEEEFRSADGASIRTNLPAAKEAMARLGCAWPRAIPFRELGEGDSFAEMMLRICASGLVELHSTTSPFTTDVSVRPRASALARLQARLGGEVATLRHSVVEIQDRLARELIMLLDGTRDHAALRAEMQAIAGSEPVRTEDLERNLAKLARLALLAA